tara:strand:- start:18 stop:650 length:633 start_codon:yes stop_codon:yes gene_type:complete
MAEQNYLIIADGHWPEEEIWRPLVKNANHVVACDGAAHQCLENHVEIQTIIGDMDSLSKEIQSQIQTETTVQFLRQDGQDENDLVKALKWVKNRGASSIEVIGIEGGDLAHQFAALFALCEIPTNARLHTSKSTIELLSKEGYKNCSIEKGTLFSLFSIGDVQGIQITGAKWNLKDGTLHPGTQGLHNQTQDECLEIEFTSGQLLLFLDR